MQQKRGKRAKVDIPDIIRNKDTSYGTSADSALRRLRKDRPDLHKQVLEKKLSPHAAMLEAGFRCPAHTSPTPDWRGIGVTWRVMGRALSDPRKVFKLKILEAVRRW